MTDRLFNSTFENSLRILILLDEFDMPQTLDRLYAIDFMSLYGRTFGITDSDLNGDNEYKFSEFASHRELIRAALKELVLDGTAQAVGYVDGLAYIITSEGEDYCESLSSAYASEYRKSVKAVIAKTRSKSGRALISSIYNMSAETFAEEVE
jgi:hypothetical protein